MTKLRLRTLDPDKDCFIQDINDSTDNGYLARGRRSPVVNPVLSKNKTLAEAQIFPKKPGFNNYKDWIQGEGVAEEMNFTMASGESVVNQIAWLREFGLLHKGFTTSQYFDQPILAVDAMRAINAGRVLEMIAEDKKALFLDGIEHRATPTGLNRIKWPQLVEVYGIDLARIFWVEDRLTSQTPNPKAIDPREKLMGDAEYFALPEHAHLQNNHVSIGKVESLDGETVAETRARLTAEGHVFPGGESLDDSHVLPPDDAEIFMNRLKHQYQKFKDQRAVAAIGVKSRATLALAG